MLLKEKTAAQIAADIKKLSDFYIKNPSSQTPWIENYCQSAYRNYFLPLNLARIKKVIERGQQVHFFDDLNHFVDWGCGPATASLAIKKVIGQDDFKFTLIDRFENLNQIFQDEYKSLNHYQFFNQLSLKQMKGSKTETCLIFSYSLTELNQWPEGWSDFEALMIIEPSTQIDARRLMESRRQLLENGYSIWAPCTHHEDCPLLKNSQKDWCHDKVIFDKDTAYTEIENFLPIKNDELTFSYILARKKSKQLITEKSESAFSKARIVGDQLHEKGKTRQLICRNSNREFLTWMHKTIKPTDISRGELIQLKNDIVIKSNEVRVQDSRDILTS